MFAMSYFRTESEALHLAVSEDGLRWEPLNGNRPLLHGTHGAGRLRDPFVFADQGGLFHLLATVGWHSDSIVHAVSDDLLDWSEQQLLPIMGDVPGVRNCWAPECFFDYEEGLYRIIWSSSVTEPSGASDGNHLIWEATTKDFASYSAPRLFFDPGYSVIDATVAYHEGLYLMAFKDERGNNEQPLHPGETWKAICICAAPRATGPFTEISEFITPSLTEGPTLFRRASGDGWTLFFDFFMKGRSARSPAPTVSTGGTSPIRCTSRPARATLACSPSARRSVGT